MGETERESYDQFRQMNLPLVYEALDAIADAKSKFVVFEQRSSERDPLTISRISCGQSRYS